jgi:L-lactate dehydrogenase complex protein LldG
MSEVANHSRERILSRISKALEKKTTIPTIDPAPLFAPLADLLQRFEAECRANITECVITRDSSETCARLRALLNEVAVGEIFAEDTPELKRFLANNERAIAWSNDGPPKEHCQATVTRCHALVALTGSILTSSACGGRGASVVAPVHIVVAKESQLVPDLEAMFATIASEKLTEEHSFVGLITGCSRTGDIEKQLVIGAHGPLRVVVIVERGS